MVLSPVPDLPWLRTAEGEVAYSTTCLHTTRAFSLILKGIGTIRKFGMSVNPYRHLGVIQQTLRETKRVLVDPRPSIARPLRLHLLKNLTEGETND